MFLEETFSKSIWRGPFTMPGRVADSIQNHMLYKRTEMNCRNMRQSLRFQNNCCLWRRLTSSFYESGEKWVQTILRAWYWPTSSFVSFMVSDTISYLQRTFLFNFLYTKHKGFHVSRGATNLFNTLSNMYTQQKISKNIYCKELLSNEIFCMEQKLFDFDKHHTQTLSIEFSVWLGCWATLKLISMDISLECFLSCSGILQEKHPKWRKLQNMVSSLWSEVVCQYIPAMNCKWMEQIELYW